MIFVGIDPGKKGAVAWIYELDDRLIVNVTPIEELPQLLHRLKQTGRGIRCLLEQVHAMPKQGVSSTFSFGVEYGWVRGLLEAHKIPYEALTPQRWKREYGLNNDKKKSIEVCRRLFPEVSLRPTDRSRVDNDGMAEALLMAEYARRHMT